MTLNETIAWNILRLRRKHGTSQKELSEAMGMNKTAISYMENPHSRKLGVKYESILSLKAHWGIDSDWEFIRPIEDAELIELKSFKKPHRPGRKKIYPSWLRDKKNRRNKK